MEMEVIFTGNKKVAAHWRGFTVIADQPKEEGGDNSAPSPFDYFLISIGQCAGFFVLAFCQERGIPTDHIKLRQRLTSNAETHMISDIKIEIQIPSDFPERYKKALIKAAESCTVKKHIQNPPQFLVKTLVG